MRNLLLKSSRGDTLVEVLIAIAVVSSVLAITYATMNRNIITTRRNQERTEASKVGQGQIESLKNLASTNQAALTSVGTNPFCIDPTNTVNPIRQTSGNVPIATGLDTEVFTNYPAECIHESLYHYGIRYEGDVYRFYVRWNQLGGGRGEVISVYRY